MITIQIDSSGVETERDILRKDIAQEFGMYTRDLRPVFSIKQLSTISSRGNGIILNFWDIKLVVGKEKVLLFHTDLQHIKTDFVPALKEKIIQKDSTVPFELRILEAAFAFAFLKINDEFNRNEASVHKTLAKLNKNISDEHFEALLNCKKRLNKLQTVAREIEEALEETIKDEEDMENLCLSKQKDELIELESILEHAWEQFEDLSHRIDELNENIDDTQEFITLKMANRRNAIIRFDLYATIITAMLSGMAVIVGAFGMNLPNHMEQNDLSFYLVNIAIILFFFAGLVFAVWWVSTFFRGWGDLRKNASTS
jgi:magnesium transporter